MASIATVYNRVFQKSAEFGEETARLRIVPGVDQSTRVRAFANEDIYFWVKRIENGRVVRRADPAASGMCWKLIGTAGAAAVLLIAVLLPSAYGLLAGYQIQNLQDESLRLTNQLSSLELDEAKLLSPARLEELARMQQFIDPAPQKLIYLDARPGEQGAMAMNKKKF
jgi:hypothetical protein